MFQKWNSVHVHGEVTDYKHGFLFIVLCCNILSGISSWMWQVNTLETNCHNTGWSLTDLKCKSKNYYHLVYKPYGNGRTQQFRKCMCNVKPRCVCIFVSWTFLWWSYHFIHWGSHFLLLFIIVDMLFNVLTIIMMCYLLYCLEKFIIYVCVLMPLSLLNLLVSPGKNMWYLLIYNQSINILYIICRYISNPSP